MIEIITLEQEARWIELVKSFQNYDVYYLPGYVKAFKLQGDGEPLLIYYNNQKLRGICVLMRRMINRKLVSQLAIGDMDLYDVVTPYGYGGFIFEGDVDLSEMKIFMEEYTSCMCEGGIVTGFFRFHPQLNNAIYFNEIAPVYDLGKTVEVALTDKEDIFKNISSKNRNMIRKAIKLGVIVNHGQGKEILEKFKHMYDCTMEKRQARQYYFFDLKFYEALDNDLKDNYRVFYAEYDNKIISAAIILFAGKRMHYHLSGSHTEYKHMASSNLLLYEAACWGASQGLNTFHLGGGIGSCEDSLYKFKQSFNPKYSMIFSTSKQVYDIGKYQQLTDIAVRKHGVDSEATFFPLYSLVQNI
ncbi:MAG: GNAT family N-acetyltransferase [Prevotellaceae bacterium]|jgi:hypothetical protein|nr:GNAT family N-acetyltransferase [Prevotellaceae bacterium]